MIKDWNAQRRGLLGGFMLWVRDECKPKSALDLIRDLDREAHVSVNHDDERCASAVVVLEAIDEDWPGLVAGCYRVIPAARKLRVTRDLQFVKDGEAGNYHHIPAGAVVDQVGSQDLNQLDREAYLRAQKRDLPRLLVPFVADGRAHWAFLVDDLEPINQREDHETPKH